MSDSTPNMQVSETIWSSAANLVQAGYEITAIITELELQLSKHNELFSYKYDGDEENNEGGCVSNKYYFWGKLIDKGKRSIPFGFLTYGFSLWREEDGIGNDWAGARDAKIYVGFDTVDGGGWDESCLFIKGDGKGLDDNYKRASNSPYIWEEVVVDEENTNQSWRDKAWFYVLPLSKINNKEDISSKLISPVRMLLSGDDKVKWAEVGAYSFKA